jgi:Domain of unknown function (DUF4352)
MSDQPTKPGWGPPPQQPPQQPPSGWGAPPPPRPPDTRPWYKKKRFLIPGALVALLLVVGIFSGGGEPTNAPTSTAAAAPTTKAAAPATTVAAPTTQPAKAGPGIGDPARDGKFEFVVTRLRCGVHRVGSQYFNKTAQGQFCLVSVRVRNIGDEQRTFEQSSQYLYDAAGRRFETSDAGLYLEDSKSFLEQINPGNGVNGTLVYDVPRTFKAAKIELHDAAFSGGVEVALA